MPEKDVVGRFDQRYCSPDPVQRVGWGYGSKVLPLVGSMLNELQRLGAGTAGLRVEIAGRDSGWHRDEWEDHDGYIGESVLGAGSKVLAAGVGREMDGWKPEVVVERRQGSWKLSAG